MDYWRGKVALVTGGSRGLGLAVVEAFAGRGAKVVVCARGEEALREAVDRLVADRLDVHAVVGDVRADEPVDALIAETVARHGRIDALVNAAGRSTRARIEDTTVEDFQELLELNFLAAVRCTRRALPHLLEARGHLIQIGSLAAKTAARYLGAYPASKHALAAYAQQLRLELGPRGLRVLLVCPGPIARADERPRYERPAAGLPESAQRPAGGARLRATDPKWLAERILAAAEKGRPELVVPARARLLMAIAQLAPACGDWLVRRWT